MADFDAELYLRLAGERMVLDRRGEGQRSGWSTPVLDIGAALVAIGALSGERAQAIATEYELALALRGNQRPMGPAFGHNPGVADRGGTPLEPVRAVRCGATIEIPWGTVETHYAFLSAEVTTLAITATMAGGNGRANRHGVMIGGGIPVAADLADDTGYRAQAYFSGGGNVAYRGQLQVQPGLSTTTEWIELDGHRIELHNVDSPVTVEIEKLADSSPAERHLWRLASGSMGHGPGRADSDSLEPIIAALVAAGAMAVDDPALDQIRSVVATLAGGGGTLRSLTGPPVALPARWASVLSRAQGPFYPDFDDGEDTSTFLVGATPPPIDGVHLRIDALVVAGRQLSARVEASPGSALGHWHAPMGRNEIAWWAEDDMGNHYLGSVGSGGGSPELWHGEINFTPPLAERVTVVKLMPTATTERLVIEVPLTDQEDSP